MCYHGQGNCTSITVIISLLNGCESKGGGVIRLGPHNIPGNLIGDTYGISLIAGVVDVIFSTIMCAYH